MLNTRRSQVLSDGRFLHTFKNNCSEKNHIEVSFELSSLPEAT